MTILNPGLCATIQDLGRPYWLAYGVPSGGAADTLSHRLANYLIGNSANAATIEVTGGFSAQVEDGVWLGFAGFGGQLWIDGRAVPPGGRSLYLPAGARLEIKPNVAGVFSYLSALGGWDVPQVLGSASNCLAAGFGGLEGRPLRVGDCLTASQSIYKQAHDKLWISPWFVRPEVFYTVGPPETLRVMPGPEWDFWPPAEQKNLFQTDWLLTPRRDRMGMRLQGNALSCPADSTMLSTGVTVGAVQVPPDGQPLILLADAQTTGGYPRIAQVIAADLPKIAQRPTASVVRFELCDLEEAEILFFAQERQLEHIRIALGTALAG